MKLSEMREVLKRFKRQRAEIDCVQLTLIWLGYVWGVGRAVVTVHIPDSSEGAF